MDFKQATQAAAAFHGEWSAKGLPVDENAMSLRASMAYGAVGLIEKYGVDKQLIMDYLSATIDKTLEINRAMAANVQAAADAQPGSVGE